MFFRKLYQLRATGRVEAGAEGAVLEMLAVTIIPEDYQHGGKLTALIVALGFTFAAMLGVIG